MHASPEQFLSPRKAFQWIKIAALSTLLCIFTSGCTVLSVADAAVSGTISVVSTGVSAASSVVKAVLPSGKEAAK